MVFISSPLRDTWAVSHAVGVYDRDAVLFFFFFNLFIYLFLAALGPRCCAWAFSSCGKWGLLFFAVRRLLIAVASFVAEHGL